MKKRLLLVASIVCLAGAVHAGITVRYYNKDSNEYEMEAKACGSAKVIKFGKSKTTSTTIQTGCSEATVQTKCGEVILKDGDKITIKDGCITVD